MKRFKTRVWRCDRVEIKKCAKNPFQNSSFILKLNQTRSLPCKKVSKSLNNSKNIQIQRSSLSALELLLNTMLFVKNFNFANVIIQKLKKRFFDAFQLY